MINFKNEEVGSLSKIILKKYPTITFGELKILFRKKDVKVDGKRINADIKLIGGEEILVYNKEKNIKTLYEDDNLIVVHKPFGVETTKVDKAYLGQSLEEMTNAFACHRIDMNTEGIVILAKNKFIQNEMFKEFKLNNIHKFYIAQVYGILNKKEDVLSGYLIKMADGVKIVDKKEKNALEIKTKYKVLKEEKECSLVEIELLTGRTHQIRAHFAHIGHFVVGDNKYGDKEINKKLGFKKQCLCSYKVTFTCESPILKYLNEIKIETEPTFLNNNKL